MATGKKNKHRGKYLVLRGWGGFAACVPHVRRKPRPCHFRFCFRMRFGAWRIGQVYIPQRSRTADPEESFQSRPHMPRGEQSKYLPPTEDPVEFTAVTQSPLLPDRRLQSHERPSPCKKALRSPGLSSLREKERHVQPKAAAPSLAPGRRRDPDSSSD